MKKGFWWSPSVQGQWCDGKAF